jgi:tRNA(Ile)-lysidine synthase
MLLREVSQALRRLGLRERALLVAVSGGVDSTALAHALRFLAQEFGLKLSIGHVNHGLRGAESAADEVHVGELAEALGVPFAAARVEPEALRRDRSSRDRPTLQEAARSLRYAALGRLADAAGADCIATAHTLDDQAETVLLRLFRGTGPDGLAGIPERSPDGRIVRPLLRVPRADVEGFAREQRISWREDASNRELGYARNRLRARWLPGLARDFNPRLLRAIGDLAEAQRRDSEWIAAWVEREAERRIGSAGSWLRLEGADWSELPPALARRLARLALERCGARRHVTRVHLERMLAFLASARPGTHLELPGGVQLIREREGFRLGPLRRGRSDGAGPGGAC